MPRGDLAAVGLLDQDMLVVENGILHGDKKNRAIPEINLKLILI